MKQDNNHDTWTMSLVSVSAFLMSVSVPSTALCDPMPKLGVQNSTRTVPNAEGFIQRWLITLKKGRNVLRGAIINASGAADVSARFLDAKDKPLKTFTVSVGDVEK